MMFFTHTTFIGIDPTAGQRPFVYAALNEQLQLMAIDQGEMDEALAFVAGQHQAMVAVCAPRRPNQRAMERPSLRENLSPSPRPGRWTNFRVAEYLLRQHNIPCPKTASQANACPKWMQIGFMLFHRLEELGYKDYPAEGSQRQMIEVYPHACYTVLIGKAPFPKHSLEGRLQRQLVLFEHNINVPDPMRFFEEITRHRLLKGILPDEDIYSPGELDALIAAYTAWMTSTQPDQVTCLGDPEEGQIILPVKELKTRY